MRTWGQASLEYMRATPGSSSPILTHTCLDNQFSGGHSHLASASGLPTAHTGVTQLTRKLPRYAHSAPWQQVVTGKRTLGVRTLCTRPRQRAEPGSPRYSLHCKNCCTSPLEGNPGLAEYELESSLPSSTLGPTPSLTHTHLITSTLHKCMHTTQKNVLQESLLGSLQRRLRTYAWTPNHPTVALLWSTPRNRCPHIAALSVSLPTASPSTCTVYSKG